MDRQQFFPTNYGKGNFAINQLMALLALNKKNERTKKEIQQKQEMQKSWKGLSKLEDNAIIIRGGIKGKKTEMLESVWNLLRIGIKW